MSEQNNVDEVIKSSEVNEVVEESSLEEKGSVIEEVGAGIITSTLRNLVQSLFTLTGYSVLAVFETISANASKDNPLIFEVEKRSSCINSSRKCQNF